MSRTGLENVLYAAFHAGWMARPALITSGPRSVEEIEEEIELEFMVWLRSVEKE